MFVLFFQKINLKLIIINSCVFFFILFFFSGNDYQCSKIDYFPKDEYSPDPNDSTMAIPCKNFIKFVFFIVVVRVHLLHSYENFSCLKNNSLPIFTGRALTENSISLAVVKSFNNLFFELFCSFCNN